MKRYFILACCFLSFLTVNGQDIQSGLWYSDSRSVGMGGAMMASGNDFFSVNDYDGLTSRQDSDVIEGQPVVCTHVLLNGLLPYCQKELAILTAGAVIDWKQYSWWLHGGLCGAGEQFVSLLFGQTVGQCLRYVIGLAMYRLDFAKIMAGATFNKGKAGALMAFMAEAGVFYRPLETLQIGVWMGNPTMTHRDSLYFATDYHLAAEYDVSDRLQLVFELEKQLQHSLFVHAGMEMAIWHPSDGRLRMDGRLGVRYPDTEVSAGIGVLRSGKKSIRIDAAGVCDWKLGWSFALSAAFGF